MKNAYFKELKEIFDKDEALQKDHAKLYETITLINKAIEVQAESLEINQKLNKLNEEKKK